MSGLGRAACGDFSMELGGISDRRDWHREPARDTEATLSWLQDDGPQCHAARLLDIGGGDVALLISRVPPRGRLLSRRLYSLENIPVEGRVVDAKHHHKPGKHLVRIKFARECPTALSSERFTGRTEGRARGWPEGARATSSGDL
jgi:hypothetical protein